MKKVQNLDKIWTSGVATKSTQVKKIPSFVNIFLWITALAVIIIGIVITMNTGSSGVDYSSYNSSIVAVVILLSLTFARFTNQGRRFWFFLNASRLELSKVVWPTRKETMTTTIVVLIAVVIFAIFISIFGMIFEKLIQYFLS